jgi:hypothetical protein
MEKYNFVALIFAFFAGYIFKTIMYRIMVYNQSSEFVKSLADRMLMLVGSIVYKMAVVDQVCALAVSRMKDTEEAKILRNQMQDNFNEWKKEIIQDFKDKYPAEFDWQIEFIDWQGAMEELTSIYKKGSE